MATGRSPCFYIEELNKYQQKNCVEVRYCELYLEWACIPGRLDPGIEGKCERLGSPKGQRGSLGEESIVPGVDEGYRDQL